jgi:hypothetical protein
VQLGWQREDFARTLYLEVITPSGYWAPGFVPLVGLHRPGIDIGWACTWTNKQTKLQVNGGLDVQFREHRDRLPERG